MPTANRVRSNGSSAGRSAISASAAAARPFSARRAATAIDHACAQAAMSLARFLRAVFVPEALDLRHHCRGHDLADEIGIALPADNLPLLERVGRYRIYQETVRLHRGDRIILERADLAPRSHRCILRGLREPRLQ